MRLLAGLFLALFVFSSPASAAPCTEFGPESKNIAETWLIPQQERPRFTSAILKAMNDLGSKDCEVWVALVSVIESQNAPVVGNFRLGFLLNSGKLEPVGEAVFEATPNESQKVKLLFLRLPGYEFRRAGPKAIGVNDA